MLTHQAGCGLQGGVGPAVGTDRDLEGRAGSCVGQRGEPAPTLRAEHMVRVLRPQRLAEEAAACIGGWGQGDVAVVNWSGYLSWKLTS